MPFFFFNLIFFSIYTHIFSPDGKYLDAEGQTGIRFCKNCPRGMYLDADAPRQKERDCKSCGAGKYMTEDGMDSESNCEFCPFGYHNRYDTSWDKIGANKKRHHACEKCATGKFADEFMSATCKDCRKGTYLTEEGATHADACIPCAESSWGENKGATQKGDCKLCPPGLFGNEKGLISKDQACHPCGTGEEAGLLDKLGNWTRNKGFGSTRCLPCRIGFFMDKRMREQNGGRLFCRVCEGANVTGMDFCPGCAGGRYGKENDVRRPCKNCEYAERDPCSFVYFTYLPMK